PRFLSSVEPLYKALCGGISPVPHRSAGPGDTCVPCSPRRPQARGLAVRAAGTARGPGNPLTGTKRSRRVDDLAVVVGTACRARGVGQLGVTAARAGDQHRARRLPLGTALAGVAPRHLPLRDGHFNPPGSPPRGRGRSLDWSPPRQARGRCAPDPWVPGHPAVRGAALSAVAGVLRDFAERLPTGVDTFSVAVIWSGLGEFDPALGAQAGTVRTAQRGEWEGEYDGVPDHRFEVDQIAHQIVVLILVVRVL